MGEAWRCDRCGRFGEGSRAHVSFYVGADDDISRWQEIDLCADCAPAVLEPLKAIAETKHDAS